MVSSVHHYAAQETGAANGLRSNLDGKQALGIVPQRIGGLGVLSTEWTNAPVKAAASAWD